MYKYFFGLALLAATNCKGQGENYVTSLSGAYEMLSQSLEGGSGDTTFTDRKQLKIYTDRHMMYVRLDPEDFVSSFGIGTFSIRNGRLTEHIIYSASDSVENTNSFSGTVNVSKRLKGYEQVIPQIMSDRGRVKLTEDYQLLEAGLRSLIDGSWKLTAAYTVNGKDSMHNKAVKYKTYYKGNFSAGSFNTSSSGEKYTIIEYGTFRMNGRNNLKENISYSTKAVRKGKSYVLDVIMKDKDTFTTTSVNADGVREVEKYSRMK